MGGMPFNIFIPGMGGAPGAAGFGAGGQPLPGGFDPLQLLFGLSQGGPVDPAMIQEVFGGGAGGIMFQQPNEQVPPERRGPPPTSRSALRTLPRVKVTAYDIVANEGNECSICLSDLEAGKTALRLPCNHCFHVDCIEDWLKKSNECPVCRFELPTDDAEYEQGRLRRMEGRKLRMRKADLDMKSAQELRRLSHFIGVDVRGCLEKSEIVDRIVASPRVQVVQADVFDSSGNRLQLGPVQTFSSSQLDSMSISEVRHVMERLGVDTAGCSDKAELLAHLCMSGRILVSEELAPAASELRPQAADAPTASSASQPPSPAAATGPLQSRSVGELRTLAREHKVSLDGCLEKADIVDRLKAVGL